MRSVFGLFPSGLSAEALRNAGNQINLTTLQRWQEGKVFTLSLISVVILDLLTAFINH